MMEIDSDLKVDLQRVIRSANWRIRTFIEAYLIMGKRKLWSAPMLNELEINRVEDRCKQYEKYDLQKLIEWILEAPDKEELTRIIGIGLLEYHCVIDLEVVYSRGFSKTMIDDFRYSDHHDKWMKFLERLTKRTAFDLHNVLLNANRTGDK